tara:strand:+ start:421728 stop:423734 length:2007 start_codon:yes stop_codon:yes gene_type:complete
MAKYLVIVEAPRKTSKYQKYLGKDYKVVATAGHVIDLPSKGINIKIRKDKKSGDYDFDPQYDVMDGKDSIVDGIIKDATKYGTVYVMTDPDREGEAIGWHVANQLPAGTKVIRASTNSITQQGIADALKNARQISDDLVYAYEARRMLDRIVGYKCSYLTKTATGGPSVGRVQSAALRVLAEREEEIQSFKPQEYWDIEAELLTSNKHKVPAKLVKPDKMDIDNKTKADKIVQDLQGQTVTISVYDVKQVSSKPYAPFTTSTLQQAASTYLHWNPKKTMQVAQALYSNGDITYHRTDSTSISPIRVAAIRTHIQTAFAPKYLPKNPIVYKTAVKNAQEAHEAILPNDPAIRSAGSSADEKKLYDLIWRRSVASQMSNAESENINVKFAYKSYELETRGIRSLFDGWKKVWTYAMGQDVILPQMAKGDKLDIIDIDAQQKFTQPPPRYSGASLVKTLEKSGIGRPSTFASIIDTLTAREYVEEKKRVFHVTDLGLKVVKFLKDANFCFIDLQFTANMENDLDLISNQKATKENVLNVFYKRLLQDIDNAKKIKASAQMTGIPCPKCGTELMMKHGRFGSFFACQDKDNCGFTANVGEDGKPKEKAKKEYGPDPCPNCKAKMVKRKSKFGEFFGCEKYPECKGMRDMNGDEIKPKPKTGKKKRYTRKKKP